MFKIRRIIYRAACSKCGSLDFKSDKEVFVYGDKDTVYCNNCKSQVSVGIFKEQPKRVT